MKIVVLFVFMWLCLASGFDLTQEKEQQTEGIEQKNMIPNEAFTGKYIN